MAAIGTAMFVVGAAGFAISFLMKDGFGAAALAVAFVIEGDWHLDAALGMLCLLGTAANVLAVTSMLLACASWFRGRNRPAPGWFAGLCLAQDALLMAWGAHGRTTDTDGFAAYHVWVWSLLVMGVGQWLWSRAWYSAVGGESPPLL